MHTPRRGEIWGIFGSFFSSEIANQNLNQIIVIPKLPRNSNSVFHSFLSTKKQNTEIRILHSYSTSISSTKEIGTLVTRKVTNINNSYIYLNLNIVKLWEHVYLLYYSLILMVTTLLQLGSFFFIWQKFILSLYIKMYEMCNLPIPKKCAHYKPDNWRMVLSCSSQQVLAPQRIGIFDTCHFPYSCQAQFEFCNTRSFALISYWAKIN